MIPDTNGGSIIVWEDYQGGEHGVNIHAQRLSSTGHTRWQTGGIPVCTAAGTQRRPQLVTDGAGGAIIVWEDDRYGSFDIFAQRIDSSGIARWQTNGIQVCNAAWAQQFPAMISDGLGGAIVTWQDSRVAGYAVYAQRINDSGSTVWLQNGIVVCDYTASQMFPRITTDGRDGAIIAWEDSRLPNTGHDIRAQRVSGAGQLLWQQNGAAVCIALNQQRDAQILPDGQYGAIIVWQDLRAGATNADIYAQRINQFGQVQWQTNGIPICSVQGNQRDPKAVPDLFGGAVVAWIDERYGYSSRIFTQRISDAGALLWSVTDVDICASARDVEAFSLVSDGSGGGLYAWQDGRSGANNVNIYAQRIHLYGARPSQWSAGGLLVCGANDNQTDPQLIVSGERKAIATWSDQRNATTGTDVYATAFYTDSAALMPVEFASFNASACAEGVRLIWTTEHERNTAGFRVQRAIERLEWIDVGFVTAAGDHAHRGAYAFIDTLPPGSAAMNLRYRIVGHDFDGSTTTSPAISIAWSGIPDAAFSLHVSPNPARESATIQVDLNHEAIISLFLTDAVGRRLSAVTEQHQASAGRTVFPVRMSTLPRGAYFIVLQTGVASTSRQFILY